jgi:hypothetical protein
MAVTELSSAWVTPYDPRRRAAERRPPREPPARALPEMQAALPAPSAPPPMFRPDLSQLSAPVEPAPAPFDIALGQLVSAVRQGDLARARAAFEALETEMLVERSAGSVEQPSVPLFGESAPPSPYDAVAPSMFAADDAYETLSHYLDADGHV